MKNWMKHLISVLFIIIWFFVSGYILLLVNFSIDYSQDNAVMIQSIYEVIWISTYLIGVALYIYFVYFRKNKKDRDDK